MKKFNLNLVSKYRSELMGFSILWIWFLHMSFKFPFPISAIQSLGATGVDIFFFVSAVGIYYSFSKNENVGQFYKKRFLRIMPIYLLISIPYRICELLFVEHVRLGSAFFVSFIKRIFLVDFWIKGDASLWYIPAILVFYLSYPLLYKLFNTENKLSNRVVFLVLISVIAVVLNAVLVHFDVPRPTDRWILRVPIFLLGCFCAPYVKSKKEVKNSNAVWIVFLILVSGLFTVLNIKTGYLHLGGILWGMLFNSMVALPLIVLIPSVLERFSLKWLQKILISVGKYTLEIYILNEATLAMARNITESNVLIDIISLFATCLILLAIIFIRKMKSKAA